MAVQVVSCATRGSNLATCFVVTSSLCRNHGAIYSVHYEKARWMI